MADGEIQLNISDQNNVWNKAVLALSRGGEPNVIPAGSYLAESTKTPAYQEGARAAAGTRNPYPSCSKAWLDWGLGNSTEQLR